MDETTPLLLIASQGDAEQVREHLTAAINAARITPTATPAVPFTATMGTQVIYGAALPVPCADLAGAQAFLDRAGIQARALTFATVTPGGHVAPFTHSLTFPVIVSNAGPDALTVPLTAETHARLREQINAARALASLKFGVHDPFIPWYLTSLPGNDRAAALTGYMPAPDHTGTQNAPAGSMMNILHVTASDALVTLHLTGDINDELIGTDPYETHYLQLTPALEAAHV